MNNRDVMDAVLVRAQAIKRKKVARNRCLATVICGILLVVGFSTTVPVLLENKEMATLSQVSLVGSLLSSPQFLAYAVVAVFALLVGIVVTLLCGKWRKWEKRGGDR